MFSPSNILLSSIFTTLCLALTVTGNAADTSRSPSLKTAFKDHFPVGTAINRSHATGHSTGRRTLEQVGQEIALIKAQFNQVTAENDMKPERNSKPKPAFDAVIRVAKEPPAVSRDLTPLHDASRVLVNPHKGWYHHYPSHS
jgi:GH35 family endo-1,4-beta-xylanase